MKIISLQQMSNVFSNNLEDHICYEIIYEKDGEQFSKSFLVVKPHFSLIKESNEIICDRKKYINGFKVVRMSDGMFAYIKESDRQLLPYRYDIALDFNKYGFAMVGKNGKVSWINQNFQYFSRKTAKMCDENLQDKRSKFDGWCKINDFGNNKYPLSLVYNGSGGWCYLDLDGNVKKFYHYDGDIDKSCCSSASLFSIAEKFNEEGIAICDNKILFDDGIYLTKEDFLKLCQENGYLEKFRTDASKKLQKIKK